MNLKVLKYIKRTLKDDVHVMKMRSKVFGKSLDQTSLKLAKEALDAINNMIKEKEKSND